MNESSGLSASDVLALTRNDGIGGNNFWWIIVFLIVAGMFGGNLFGNSNGASAAERVATSDFISSQFSNQNDKFIALQNGEAINRVSRDVLETSNATNVGILNAANNTDKEILQSRYDNSLGQCNIEKTILLGNQNMQSQLSACCCDLKSAIHAEGEATRAMITENTIQELRDNLQAAQLTLGNATQTQNLLNAIGRYNVVSIPYNTYPYSYPYSYPYGCGVSSVV